jgi:hypothetical protein
VAFVENDHGRSGPADEVHQRRFIAACLLRHRAVREDVAVVLRRLGRVGCMASLLLAASAHLDAGDRRLTIKEAEQLARAALTPEARRLPGLSLEPDKNPRRCVTFDVLWSNPGPGSVHSQFLSVDLQTAEVWSPTVWRRLTTPALRTAQRDLRTRLQISDAEVKKALDSEHIVCEE